MTGIPCIEAKCKCGEKWLIAMPAWESPWSSWTEGGYSNCKKCKSLPETFRWVGLQSTETLLIKREDSEYQRACNRLAQLNSIPEDQQTSWEMLEINQLANYIKHASQYEMQR